MGKYNSSLTRVKPIFDKLIQLDTSGSSWIPMLLQMAQHGHPKAQKVEDISDIQSYKWGYEEAELAPPVSLLSWLIRNLSSCGIPKPQGDGTTSKKRRALYDQDSEVIKEALNLLQNGKSNKEWYILEGVSQPDAYIITDEAIIVVEGKRTELGPTTNTTWMANRNQMLRHLDAAWEIRGSRDIYGLLIVEGKKTNPLQIPANWIEAANEIYSVEAVRQSLPHRGPDEQHEIARSFNGVLTWQLISQKYNIDWNSIPEEI